MTHKLLLGIALLAACHSRTELMLGIATDLGAPDGLDRVELAITSERDSMLVDWDITGSSSAPFNLPGSYGVVSDGDEVSLDIVLTGYRGGTALTSRRAVVSLVEDQTLFYRIGLTAACVGRDDCPPDWSCVEGVCRDVTIDAQQLPEFAPELVTELTCASGVAYTDTATKQAMTLATGAADCPGSLCLEGTCLKPPPAAVGTRMVTGTRIVTHVQENQRLSSVPVDLSTLEIAALVLDGDGPLRGIRGVGRTDGSLVIEGVPHGTYYLRLGSTYYVTSESSLDLGFVELGRTNGRAPTQTTSIALNVTNLSAWAAGDMLEVFAPEANAWWFFLEQSHPIAAGATSLTNYTFSDQDGSVPNLIDNDELAVVQYTSKQTTDGQPYRAATRVFKPARFSQTDGGTSTLTGAFELVPQTGSISLDMRGSEWADVTGFDGTHATLLHPEATPYRNRGVYATLAGQPGGSSYGFFSPTLDYVFADVPHGDDRMLADLSYGLPHIANVTYVPVLHAESFFQVRYLLPDTTTPAMLYVGVQDTRPVTTSVITVSPGLGPVRDATIAGRTVFEPQQAVGRRPEIAWQAPALGIATQYRVELYRLSRNQTTTERFYVGSLFTADTSVVVPDGLLEAGQPHVLVISADTSGNIAAPYRLRYPHTYSAIASAVFTP